jgi:hypothetical protein
MCHHATKQNVTIVGTMLLNQAPTVTDIPVAHLSGLVSVEQLITVWSLRLFKCEQVEQLIKTLEQRLERRAVVCLRARLLHRTVQITVKISLWRCSRSLSLNNIERIATKVMQ